MLEVEWNLNISVGYGWVSTHSLKVDRYEIYHLYNDYVYIDVFAVCFYVAFFFCNRMVRLDPYLSSHWSKSEFYCKEKRDNIYSLYYK